MKENRGQTDLNSRDGTQEDIFEGSIGYDGILQIAACLSRTPESIDLLLLISRLQIILDRYLVGQNAIRNYRLEKEENQAYDRIAAKAMQLQEALTSLQDFDEANKNISKGIREYTTQYVRSSDGANLTHILDDDRDHLPFHSLCRHLEDLAFVAQRSVNLKPPKPLIASNQATENY